MRVWRWVWKYILQTDWVGRSTGDSVGGNTGEGCQLGTYSRLIPHPIEDQVLRTLHACTVNWTTHSGPSKPNKQSGHAPCSIYSQGPCQGRGMWLAIGGLNFRVAIPELLAIRASMMQCCNGLYCSPILHTTPYCLVNCPLQCINDFT